MSGVGTKAFPLLKVDRRCCGGDRCSEVVKGYQSLPGIEQCGAL
jgi:hypothetical protein